MSRFGRWSYGSLLVAYATELPLALSGHYAVMWAACAVQMAFVTGMLVGGHVAEQER